MTDQATNSGLLVIDYINEIIDPKGKLSGKGYSDFARRHTTIARTSSVVDIARLKQIPVFFVRLGFSPDYREHPASSPLLGTARKFGALQNGTWATEFHPSLSPRPNELLMTKHRVSAFYGTPLELILRTCSIRDLFICGVATDLAVESAARDAHDRDFNVTVLSDCCTAANDDDHERALRVLAKIASVKRGEESVLGAAVAR